MKEAWEIIKANPAPFIAIGLAIAGIFGSIWVAIFNTLAKAYEKSHPIRAMVFAALAGINFGQIIRAKTGKDLENDPSVRAAIESPIAPVESTRRPPPLVLDERN